MVLKKNGDYKGTKYWIFIIYTLSNLQSNNKLNGILRIRGKWICSKVVFEIIRSHQEGYEKELNDKINPEDTTREKVFLLFNFILKDNEEFEKHQNIYKEYMSIAIAGGCSNMCKFDNECAVFFKTILTKFIEDGVLRGELISSSKDLIFSSKTLFSWCTFAHLFFIICESAI